MEVLNNEKYNFDRRTVSVIVPVYNERIYLEACVESILNQTYRNIELILVDDGSDEDVAHQCDKFKTIDKRKKVIHKKNEGLSSARIAGVERASGDYYFFVDDDDVIIPTCLEILVACDNGICEIISGRSVDCENVDLFQVNQSNSSIKYEIVSGKTVCKIMADDNCKRIITPLWGKLYAKSFFERIDLNKYKSICPTIYFEDVLMTPILYRESENVCLVDCIIYLHRELPNSISHAVKLGPYYYEQIESGNLLLSYCKEKDIPEMFEFELEIYYRVILRIFCLIDKEKIDNTEKIVLKKKVEKYFRKYYRDLINSDQSFLRKIFYSSFLINKKLWAALVRYFYFNVR